MTRRRPCRPGTVRRPALVTGRQLIARSRAAHSGRAPMTRRPPCAPSGPAPPPAASPRAGADPARQGVARDRPRWASRSPPRGSRQQQAAPLRTGDRCVTGRAARGSGLPYERRSCLAGTRSLVRPWPVRRGSARRAAWAPGGGRQGSGDRISSIRPGNRRSEDNRMQRAPEACREGPGPDVERSGSWSDAALRRPRARTSC